MSRPLVDGHGEGGVLKRETFQRLVERFALVGVARLDGERDDRLIGVDGFEQQPGAGRGHGIAGARRAQADDRHDVPGHGGVHLLAAVGVQPVQAGNPFVGPAGDVAAGIAFPQRPGVDPDEGQLAAAVHHDLEDQPGEGQSGIAGDGGVGAVFGVVPRDGRQIGRRGQVGDHRVEKRLHAGVFERRAAEHRGHAAGQRGAPDGGTDVRFRVLAAEIEIEKGVVVFGKAFQHLLAPRRGKLRLRGIERRTGPRPALIGLVEIKPFLGHEIDDAPEILGGAHGDGDGQGIRAEPRPHGLEHGGEIRADAIHLVDEGQLGHAEVFRLPPDGFGLRLHAAHGAEDAYRAVEHPERAFHLDGEVHMPGRVDDVDGGPVPFAGGAGRGDGDAAFLFLGQIVHGGRAVVDFAHAVDFAGVEQHPLRKRGFPRVDMRDDADVAHSLCHEDSFLEKARPERNASLRVVTGGAAAPEGVPQPSPFSSEWFTALSSCRSTGRRPPCPAPCRNT